MSTYPLWTPASDGIFPWILLHSSTVHAKQEFLTTRQTISSTAPLSICGRSGTRTERGAGPPAGRTTRRPPDAPPPAAAPAPPGSTGPPLPVGRAEGSQECWPSRGHLTGPIGPDPSWPNRAITNANLASLLPSPVTSSTGANFPASPRWGPGSWCR